MIGLKSKMLSIGREIKEPLLYFLSCINHLSIKIEDFHLKEGFTEPILFPAMLG